MDKKISNKDKTKDLNSDNVLETDIVGFDGLWQVSYNDTQNFIRSKSGHIELDTNARLELSVLNRELEDKDFELQKLQWQLSERDKELKNLYEELHRMMDLNRKLNRQLEDLHDLSSKQTQTLRTMSKAKYQVDL